MISFNSALSSVKRQKSEVKPSKTIFDSGNIWSIVLSFLSISEALDCKKVCKSWNFHVKPFKFFLNPQERVQEFADFWFENGSNRFSQVSEDWKEILLKQAVNVTSLNLDRVEYDKEFKTNLLIKALKVTTLVLSEVSVQEIELISHLPLTKLTIFRFKRSIPVHITPDPLYNRKFLQTFWSVKTLEELSTEYHEDFFAFHDSIEVFPNLKSLELNCKNSLTSNFKDLGKLKSLTSLKVYPINDTHVLSHEIVSELSKLKKVELHCKQLFNHHWIAITNSSSLESLTLRLKNNLDICAGNELMNLLSSGTLRNINYHLDLYGTDPFLFDSQEHPIFNREEVTVTLEFYNFFGMGKFNKDLNSKIKNLNIIIHFCLQSEDFSDIDEDGIEDLEDIINYIANLTELKKIEVYFSDEILSNSLEEEAYIYFFDKFTDFIQTIHTTKVFRFTTNILTQLRKKP